MKTLNQLMAHHASVQGRIESLQGHIVNMHLFGGEGRLMLASQFEEKVEKLKQKLYELNLEIEAVRG